MAFDQQELWEQANERPTWHERLESEEAVQSRVHKLETWKLLLVAALNFPESSYFYVNVLRAVALSSSVSTSLLELAVRLRPIW
ncbi:hypothetical protein OROMI_002593 [Orobanche minor]